MSFESAEKPTPIETIVIDDWQHNDESPEEDRSIVTPVDPVTLTSSPKEVSPEVEKRKSDHQLTVQPEKSTRPQRIRFNMADEHVSVDCCDDFSYVTVWSFIHIVAAESD